MNDSVQGNLRIAHNMVFVYGRLIITTIIGLLSTRFALMALGQSDYGLYNVVGGIVIILNVLSTAMSTTTRRFINAEMGKTDGNLNRIFNICRNMNFGYALLIFILAETIGLIYIYNFLNVSQDKFKDAIVIFEISTFVAALGVINVTYQSLIAAFEDFKEVAIVDVATSLIKLALIMWLSQIEGNRLIIYAIMLCVATCLSLLLYSGYCHRKWPEIIIFRRYRDRHTYKEILEFNNYTALGASTYIARAQGGNMIINFFFSTIVNGAYSIAYMIENYAMMIVSNLTTAVAPQIAKSYSSNDIDRAFYLSCKINRYSILFMLAIVFLMLLDIDFIMKIWLGIVPYGARVLCSWTLISAFSRSLGEGIPPYIQATGKIKWFSIFGSISELIVLPIAIYLYYREMPPVTIVVVYVIFTLLYKAVSFYLLYKIEKFDVKEFLIRSYVPSFKCVFFAGLFLLLYQIFLPEVTIWKVIGLLLACAYIAVVIFYIGLTAGERNKIIALVKNYSIVK